MYRQCICAFWLRCSEGCIQKKNCSQRSKRNFNSFAPQFWWIQPLVTFSKPRNTRNNRRATCSLTASAQRERRSNFKTVMHSQRSLQSQSWATTRWTSNLWWTTPLIGQNASSLATTHWQLFRKISFRVYEAWIPADKSAARRYPCTTHHLNTTTLHHDGSSSLTPPICLYSYAERNYFTVLWQLIFCISNCWLEYKKEKKE